ncbi:MULTISPECIES: hypothetical protein [Haloarcula]|uniref:hypothetical protein n=1 Tax=Haloarcula TaxID=2237 RepID=UPI0023E79AD3|nr:hypothetical protein [Halomicroarcula sp. SHR3]
MSRLEGASVDDCERLRDDVGAMRSEIRESEDYDHELLVAATKSHEFLMSACGLGYYPTEDGEYTTDKPEEIHSTIDEMEDSIVETIPDALVRDDISFNEEAALENKKRIAVSQAADAKESLNEVTDEELDTTERNPKGPETIVCKYSDPDKKRECIERRTNNYDDVNWTGVTN